MCLLLSADLFFKKKQEKKQPQKTPFYDQKT